MLYQDSHHRGVLIHAKEYYPERHGMRVVMFPWTQNLGSHIHSILLANATHAEMSWQAGHWCWAIHLGSHERGEDSTYQKKDVYYSCRGSEPWE